MIFVEGVVLGLFLVMAWQSIFATPHIALKVAGITLIAMLIFEYLTRLIKCG